MLRTPGGRSDLTRQVGCPLGIEAARSAAAEIDGRRDLDATALGRVRAAIGIHATAADRAGRRQKTGYGLKPALILARAVGGPAAQESHGVGMARIAEHAGGWSLLHELTGVQDPHAIAQARDHRQIVADEEDGV